MLTKKQNLLETIRGGAPDRFVNQYEAFAIMYGEPFMKYNPLPGPGTPDAVNAWGVTNSWPADQLGMFPVHTPDKVVIKDLEEWRDYVTEPPCQFSDEEWAPFLEAVNAVDRNEQFVTAFMAPGIFEMCHNLLEIQECLCGFYEYPDEMHELIDMLTDWEIRKAKDVCAHMHPEALLHHDDWGSKISTFLSPEMFREFIKPAYEKIYAAWREGGVQVIVHHSDSFAATLVEDMIDMGIDIWQGVLTTNNVPELVKKYGGKISFMGGIETEKVDFGGWTQEGVREEVRRACNECGKHYYIPCVCQGGPGSSYPGVYEAISEEIAAYSKEYFA